MVRIHLQSFVPLLFFKTVANHSVYLHFTFILLHFKTCQTLLKIWSEFIFSHSYLCYSSKLVKHSVYLHSATFCSVLRQIRQCWKFDQNPSLVIHSFLILQNCGQPQIWTRMHPLRVNMCNSYTPWILNLLRTWVLFVESLIPLFWTSGDIYPGSQSQGGSLACMLLRLCTMDAPDWPLVGHLLTSPRSLHAWSRGRIHRLCWVHLFSSDVDTKDKFLICCPELRKYRQIFLEAFLMLLLCMLCPVISTTQK